MSLLVSKNIHELKSIFSPFLFTSEFPAKFFSIVEKAFCPQPHKIYGTCMTCGFPSFSGFPHTCRTSQNRVFCRPVLELLLVLLLLLSPLVEVQRVVGFPP